MYQTVGHQGIEFIAEAMELPLYRRETKGKSNQTEKHYVPQENDEVEDLFDLLTQVKVSSPQPTTRQQCVSDPSVYLIMSRLSLPQTEVDFEAISVGAILSDYQRIRVENVCGRLGLISLAYLWRRDQKELLQEMIDSQLHAIIIKVSGRLFIPPALGLIRQSLPPTGGFTGPYAEPAPRPRVEGDSAAPAEDGRQVRTESVRRGRRVRVLHAGLSIVQETDCRVSSWSRSLLAPP